MLAFLGFLMIITFMLLIMSKKMYALTALIIVPIIFGLIGGFGNELGNMMMEGIKKIAPTGVMLIFGIMYFSIMIDVGLFDPLVAKILKLVKGDPLKVTIGTAILTLMVSLDGDGATTYLIVVSAMLPLYKRLGIPPLKLTAIIMCAGGVMNVLPWGGPTARAMTSLHLSSADLFIPVLPSLILGGIWVIFMARIFGMQERKRMHLAGIDINSAEFAAENDTHLKFGESGDQSLKRPKLLLFNFLLTAALLIAMVLNLLPLTVMFMIAFAIAIIINYPRLEEQHDRIRKHADNALSVSAMIFAAGIFTGILSGTKMMDAMALTMISAIPADWGSHLPLITGLATPPLTFFMSNDAYYFGILPLIGQTAQHLNVPIAEVGRAALFGGPVHLLSPLVPSTYLLVGLAGVSFADHMHFTLKWASITCLVMLAGGFLFGVISL